MFDIEDTTSINNIPIIIVCHNNYKYVQNTINQLYKKTKLHDVIVMDSASTCTDTLNFLNDLEKDEIWSTKFKVKVFRNSNNHGPWVYPECNGHIYNEMPEKFILTDPDLQFNLNLPDNFIEVLSQISDKYECFKVGFALDISDFDKMYQSSDYVPSGNPEVKGHTIYDWEEQYWKTKIDDDYFQFPLYKASIDTTFVLINKKFINNDRWVHNIRVGGDFTAKHLSWYIENEFYSLRELYILNKDKKISTISRVVIPYVENNYFKVCKRNEVFFVKNNHDEDPNLGFWKDSFHCWENETFDVFDKVLDKNKILIDIGAWIGTTSIYGLMKSKHVYCVEADNESFKDLDKNLRFNFTPDNFTLINNAIYNIDDATVNFGKNKFCGSSRFNDSTSHIHYNVSNDESNSQNPNCYTKKTITLRKIFEKFNIRTEEVSLIKVDIEGGEENILEDLYTKFYVEHRIPLYVSFHYEWWINKDLNRFIFLTESQKQHIIYNPFTTIFFG